MKEKPHKCSCGRDCWGLTFAKENLDRLHKEFNDIVAIVNKNGVTHPIPYLIYEFEQLINRFGCRANIVFIHSKYCEKH